MKIKTGRFAVRGLVVFWLLLVSVGCWALEPQTLVNFQLGLSPVRGALIEAPDGNFYGTSPGGGPRASGTVFRITPAGVLTILVSDQPSPAAGLVVGNDGLLYGMTETGGPFVKGTVFKTTTSGVLTNLAVLDGTNAANPVFGLVLAGDGNFYGASQGGGAHSVGAVFRVTPGGTVTTLVSFDLPTIGGAPSGLVLGRDGNLYGSTVLGGDAGHGTIFKITTGGAFTTLFSFQTTNGTGGLARLAVGPDGKLYGTTPDGGSANLGTIFRITPNGIFSTLVSFTKGAKHKSELTVGADGQLYGTTQQGGSADLGAVFKVTTNGVLTTLVSFTDPANGSPQAGLLLASDGNFYGCSQGSVFRMTPGGVLTHLVSLLPLKGIFPQSGLMLGPDGNFYGTTSGGGSNSVGTIFRLTPNGVLTSLFSFNTTNGTSPQGGLALGKDGNFYGTTAFGGPNDLGTIFRFSTNGTLTTLASFDGSNGANPQFQLVMDANGNFYGVTTEGGADGVGTVFRVTTNGVLTTLASFNDSPGAVELPEDGLTAGQDGNFYGTTAAGGSNLAGTVFKITPGGVLTNLVSFNAVNGTSPLGGLVQANDGNLYGTTGFGGTNSNFGTNSGFGTIFKVTTNGVLTTLFSFHFTDGEAPSAKLIFGSDGNLYGTTKFGGSTGGIPAANGFGTVFRITTNGLFTSLSLFQGTNGSNLQAPLVLGNDGNLYGTTSEGGTGSGGTIFRVVLNDTVSNTPPAVAITSPTDGSSFIGPATIIIQAAANDSDGSVTNVQFFDGTTSLGNVSSSPFNLSVSLAVGSHSLFAIASDNRGATTASLPVTVTVIAINSPPTVAITSPTDGTSFIAPATITIQAVANDSDGSVTNVQFFDGDTSLGNVSSSPFNLSVSLALGSHALFAEASDNRGSTTASFVRVTVTTNTPPTEVSIPDPGLNAAIRQALQKPAGTLTDQDLLTLTNLDAHGRNIHSLQGLEAAGNLVSLNLQSNQLSNFSLPSQFTDLTVLDLSLNSLTNCSFPGGLMKLATLNLQGNLLASLTLPAGLNGLSSLELSENRFTSFNLPSNLTSLTFLNLSYNVPLTNVSLPNGLTNLTRLVIQGNNNLTDLNLAPGLTALETLDLDANLLAHVSLPTDLKSLSRLNLEGNQLFSLTLPTGMTSLETLLLDLNHLNSLTLPADLTKLAFLDLTGNFMGNLTLPGSLTALSELRLPVNLLTSFALPAGLTNLTTLDLFENALTSFPLPAGLTALTNLDLGVNQLTNFTVPLDATNLTTLFLERNHLTNVSLAVDMRKLNVIGLSDNQLSSLDLPSGLTALAVLNLSNNQLTDLTLPLDMTNLTTLLLDGNPLRTLTLSQQLATTNLAALVASLRNQGVSVIILQTTPNSPPVLAAIPNQTIPVGMSLVITNLANDPDSPPQVLTFSLGAGAAANASINPASGLFNLRPPTAAQVGTNTFTVIVTDNGQPPLSATQSFSVVVLPTNSPPTIAITSPTDGSSLIGPAMITIQAEASDNDGSVTNVQFFDGDASLGNVSSSPHNLLVSLAVGSHALTALASDNLGATTTSLAVTVTVTTNSPPTVTAIVISGATRLPDGSFQFAFTNTPVASFTILTTTNSAVPVDEWTSAGAAVETSPGNYQFTDAAPDSPQRFYRVRSP